MAGSKGSKYFDVFLNCKFWLTSVDGNDILGEEILKLLREIETEGSIQASAKKNDISYRKAWGDIKNAEEILKLKIVEKKRGGKDGGKTVLSEDGKRMLEAFDELEKDVDIAIHDIAKKFFRKLNDKDKAEDENSMDGEPVKEE